MNTDALQLCSRFALKPNLLGYCGRDSAPAKLYECIVNGKCEGVEEELDKFIVLNPYLQTIAKVTGKDPFSYEIVEAYWLGSDLLNQIKPQHYDLLVQNLAKQGVPDFLIEEIKDKKPKEFIPIHLFNILHVGVGKASGSVPFNLQSINNCMVRWGEVRGANVKCQMINDKSNSKIKNQNLVLSIAEGSKQEKNNPSFFPAKQSSSTGKEGKARSCREILAGDKIELFNKHFSYQGKTSSLQDMTDGFAACDSPKKLQATQQGSYTASYKLLLVDTLKLTQINGKYELVEIREEVPYLPQLVGELKMGDNVAVHWGWVAGKLASSDKSQVIKWTGKLLESIVI